MRPRQWWVESDPPGWNRVKVSENLGATEDRGYTGRPCGYIPVLDMQQGGSLIKVPFS